METGFYQNIGLAALVSSVLRYDPLIYSHVWATKKFFDENIYQSLAATPEDTAERCHTKKEEVNNGNARTPHPYR